MTSPDSWQENNARKLVVGSGGAAATPGGILSAHRVITHERCEEGATAASPEDNTDPGLPSALELLSDRLALSTFERNILLLCAAMELDTRIAGLCAKAQEDSQKNFPTFALALALFDEPFWDALSPERPLRFWRLIEISQFGAQPLTTSALRADERIVNYLKGLNYLDERVASLFLPLNLSADALELAASQEVVVQTILRRWRQPAESGALPVVQLVGDRFSEQTTRRPSRRRATESPASSAAGRVTARKPADLELLARI